MIVAQCARRLHGCILRSIFRVRVMFRSFCYGASMVLLDMNNSRQQYDLHAPTRSPIVRDAVYAPHDGWNLKRCVAYFAFLGAIVVAYHVSTPLFTSMSLYGTAAPASATAAPSAVHPFFGPVAPPRLQPMATPQKLVSPNAHPGLLMDMPHSSPHQSAISLTAWQVMSLHFVANPLWNIVLHVCGRLTTEPCLGMIPEGMKCPIGVFLCSSDSLAFALDLRGKQASRLLYRQVRNVASRMGMLRDGADEVTGNRAESSAPPTPSVSSLFVVEGGVVTQRVM